MQHIVAAKAVTFYEALQPEFKEYQQQVLKNAQVLSNTLQSKGVKIVSGGTDNHLVLLDLRGSGITGLELEQRLASVGIITNKNAIPFDKEKKNITSGVRLGTPALTSRGLKEHDMEQIGELIALTIFNFEEKKEYIKEMVGILCKTYPLDRR